MGDDSSEPFISYSIKDILDGINRKLDDALSALLSKADNARVDAIETRLGIVEQHIKHAQEQDKTRDEWRQWLIPAACAVIMAIGAVLQLFHI